MSLTSSPSPAGGARPAPGMQAAVAALDWGATPLGPRESWPQSLRTVMEVMLSSGFGMCAAWGPELTFFYNDAYAPMLGARHPGALGRPMREVWPEIWGEILPLIEQAMAGESVFYEELHLVMTRSGAPEDTWWNFSYSPLRGDDGAIAGFLNVTIDMTGKVMNERRIVADAARLRESEQRYRALVSATSDVLYQMSPDWQEMRQLDGREFLESTEHPRTGWIEQYIPPEDQPAVRATIEQAIRDKQPFMLEHRVRRRDGTIGWTQSRAVPLLNEAGEITEWFGTASDVTDQHVSRAALAASREKLELATRAARLGQFDYWPQQGRLEWDDRCRELFGLPAGAPVSYESAYVAGLHPGDRAGAVAAVEAALDPRGTHVFDTEYRTIGIEDGKVRHIHAQGLTLFEGDLPVRLIGTVQDITADRQAQATLRETEERLRLAGRATNDAIWDWDLARDHVLWNETLTTAYGHRLRGGVSDGGWWLDQIHPEDRARIYDSIHGVIDGAGTDWSEEYRFRCANGNYADIMDRGYVIRSADGKAVRMIGAMLDQSERKKVQRALEDAKAGLEEAVAERTRERDQIWQATPDLLCVASLDGFYKELNPAWTETLGWARDELLARPYLDFVHPDDVAPTRERMGCLVEGEGVFGFENRYRTASGEYVWLSWNAVPREGLIYAVVRDVTQAHEQAEALARAEDQLRQSQKMEAVGQLTGGIAHDFNNMLTGVLGSLELLRRFLDEGRADKVDRYIDAATTSAQRAAGLTQRLLAFSRRQSLDVQAVDVNRVVLGMEELLQRTVGEQIPLELRLDDATWNATTDANQLESALLNLAINARDAMPDGGALTIETGNTLLTAADAAAHEELEAGDYVMLSVTDSGAGMSADVMAKAFEPFFTTKPIGQGTGLGLSMIYGFARQTGGQVQISSTPGEGTVVRLYLRRDHGAVEEDAQIVAGLSAAATGECVLVVEDDPAVRMLVVDLLENLGYSVLSAVDGRQAMQILDARPPIRLMVSDVGLPGLNGRQLAEYARQKLPGLPVLFVTGYAEQATVRSGFLDEGMEMITKPFAIETLVNKVAEIMKGSGAA